MSNPAKKRFRPNRKRKIPPPPFKGELLPGMVFGKLVLVNRVEEIRREFWNCRCACGNVTVAYGKLLKRRDTRSCGCLKLETARQVNFKHGFKRIDQTQKEYRSWIGAKTRCFNPKNPAYLAYGGRGITMCEKWRNSFLEFSKDMGRCPPKHSIDRIDNDGNYEPGNCRWATAKEQRNNQRPHSKMDEETKHRLILIQNELSALLEPKPVWSLPDPPAGREWHRVDGWTAEMLPKGYRPLLKDERIVWEEDGDEYALSYTGNAHFHWQSSYGSAPEVPDSGFWRTRRPLPVDPPVDSYAELKAAHRAGKMIQYRWNDSEGWSDHSSPAWSPVCQYRVKPEPVMVPLSREDVPPGSVFRNPDHPQLWQAPRELLPKGVVLSSCSGSFVLYAWEELQIHRWEILLPGQSNWKPCQKPEGGNS